jgi:hypothetical protein
MEELDAVWNQLWELENQVAQSEPQRCSERFGHVSVMVRID